MDNNEKDIVNQMQLPEDFWAFSFELNNSHLFQQNLIPALHDNDVTDVVLVLMPVSEMTYIVSSGTLNSSIPYHT